MTKTYEIRVKGLVQGVGFRPFVYRLAKKHKLKGFVLNDSLGVKIHVNGLSGTVQKFVREIKISAPPLSEITSIDTKRTRISSFRDFSIVESMQSDRAETLISPDISVCDDCLSELGEPKDRRYLYPFINCTNCGPRFTIINSLPYDRPNTTMAQFRMCGKCSKEYNDPSDRRFHAQPIACPDCGPKLFLYNSKLSPVRTANPLEKAINLLKEGKILAIKGLGGFHLACDATKNESVSRLRIAKGREEKPLAVMAASPADAKLLSTVLKEESRLLSSPERPIVLLRKRRGAQLAGSVAPGNPYLGIMLPYTPLHHLLFYLDTKTGRLRERGVNFRALVMTSANMSEEPIVIEDEEARENLKDVFDFILTHNRKIKNRADDSVLRVSMGKTLFLRKSRGFAPSPVFLKRDLSLVLALGAELKNTVCITRGSNAFLSQHIGDLKNVENFDFFKEAIANLKAVLRCDPQTVAFDMHPGYLNSKFALESGFKRKIAVQHHHAHMASCMTENSLDSRCVGIILDGTGYGIDGTVWGGEILLGDLGTFERKAYLRRISMPGGDTAAKEPYRMAFAYLYAVYGKFWRKLDLSFINRIGYERLSFLEKMIESSVNSPQTSSLGRLFDAVSSLCGIRDINSYEGQAAFELEMNSGTKTQGSYPYTVYGQNGCTVINTLPMIEALVTDTLKGRSREIGPKFHATLIEAFTKTAGQVAKAAGTRDIVLSGGCFQNVLLLEGMIRRLRKAGLKPYSHTKVPPNDGGLALGQAAVADRILRKR